MNYITPGQNRRLHYLLNQLGLMDHKAELVKEYSSIKSESSKELLSQEARALIMHLESLLGKQENPAEKMRKKMLMYGYELDWDVPLNDKQKLMKRSARVFRNVDAWCRLRGKFKKGLNEHNEKELAQLLSQFELVYKKTLKKL